MVDILGSALSSGLPSVLASSDSGAATLQTLTPASGIYLLIPLIIGLPLLGATVLLLAGRRSNAWGHWLAILMVALSFALGVAMFVQMLGTDEAQRGVQDTLMNWFTVGDFTAQFGFQLDQLSIIFVLLITGVGGLIHIYSVGYMAEDPDRRKFFAYLNLFVAGHAAAGPFGQLRAALLRVGGRRPGVVPAGRVLAVQSRPRPQRRKRPS